MSDAVNDETPAPTIGIWTAGEPTLSRSNSEREVAFATDWHVLHAAMQSGLPYRWIDSLPATPPVDTRRRLNLFAKRILDIIGALGLILVTGPVLIGIAIAIRMTSAGPPLFRQERVGLGGKMFRVLKFRTMYIDRGDDTGVAQTIDGDPRVTRIGRFLRRASLDELPQLFNVLLGQMSLVGPRPQVLGQLAGGLPYSDAVPYYGLRHVMKPGITGWAQVNGYRGPTDTLDKARLRVDHDLAYVQNFSVLLDIKILLLTVWREFVTGSGV